MTYRKLLPGILFYGLYCFLLAPHVAQLVITLGVALAAAVVGWAADAVIARRSSKRVAA